MALNCRYSNSLDIYYRVDRILYCLFKIITSKPVYLRYVPRMIYFAKFLNQWSAKPQNKQKNTPKTPKNVKIPSFYQDFDAILDKECTYITEYITFISL